MVVLYSPKPVNRIEPDIGDEHFSDDRAVTDSPAGDSDSIVTDSSR